MTSEHDVTAKKITCFLLRLLPLIPIGVATWAFVTFAVGPVPYPLASTSVGLIVGTGIGWFFFHRK